MEQVSSIDVNYFVANRSGMARFLPDKYEHVLEVGCASGGFAGSLTKARDSWGIEPHPPSAERARLLYKHVLTGTFEQVEDQLPDHHFDLLVCNDVIEHMPDHDAFIRNVRKKLKPGAYLVGSLPNVRHITALMKLLLLKDWAYTESGILDRTHLRFFTEKSIHRFFSEHGLEVEVFEGQASVIKNGLMQNGKPLPPLKNALFRAGVAGLVALSFGYYADTQYPQFGFRVKFPD